MIFTAPVSTIKQSVTLGCGIEQSLTIILLFYADDNIYMCIYILTRFISLYQNTFIDAVM